MSLKGNRTHCTRCCAVIISLLVFAGCAYQAAAQPRLLVNHETRLQRVSVPVGARLQVRLQGEPYFRHVSLAVVRADTVGLYLERASSPQTLYLPLSAIHEVRYSPLTEGKRLTKLLRSGLVIGGSTMLLVRAINSSQLAGGYTAGPGFWVAAGALGGGLVLTVLQRSRYYVGPGGKWKLSTLDF